MKEEFYKVDISSSKRESFNNTILLLTMVKSEYYYIIGFSRVKGQIEIGFDYKSSIHNTITESVIVDFYSDNENVVLSGELKNVNLEDFTDEDQLAENFYFEDNALKYRLTSQRDKLIPVSIEKMNGIIMRAKSEIFDFLEKYYKTYICKG
ncbi:hypothetical protein [Ruminococcus sp. zg-924]|uniref:hypothetical protein n=1 Tax=Ruminococcus sp. zg-924 TaxID=2678505 RepID=UPI00210BF0BC|nr:hypothetical protein [Ruminococcus sp. zg-924]MCQ4022809.1 hypothetical protein [Ruminococcus sp. zg-924]